MSNPTNESKKKIAIFTEDDYVWAFPTFAQTIPLLLEKHELVGIYLFSQRLGKLEGIQKYLWHLRVFGFWNFLITSLFAVKKLWNQLWLPIRTWRQLADHYEVELHYAPTPNSETVINWTKENEIDIVILMVDHILKKEIINSPKIGIINKHAAILPSCRGIFPFFWARLNDIPTGITFHEVDTGIDTGNILVQMNYPEKEHDISMLRFYMDVYALFPEMALLAIDRLISHTYIVPLLDINSSYFSLPQRSDFKRFQKMGFRICSFRDLVYRPPDHIKALLSQTYVAATRT